MENRLKIYVASSWRNIYHPAIVERLKKEGFLVYDYRNPEPGNTGFKWSSIDPNWKEWNFVSYKACLNHLKAFDGFNLDYDAMKWANVGFLVNPSGKSAHIEAGYFVGAGKVLCIYMPPGEPFEPELMYKMSTFLSNNLDELIDNLKTVQLMMKSTN